MVWFPKVFLHSNISLPDSSQTLLITLPRVIYIQLKSHTSEDTFLLEYPNHLLNHVNLDHIYMSRYHTCIVPSSE